MLTIKNSFERPLVFACGLLLLSACTPEEVGRATLGITDDDSAPMRLAVNTCGHTPGQVLFDLDDAGWVGDTVILEIYGAAGENFSLDVTSAMAEVLQGPITEISEAGQIRITVTQEGNPNANIAIVTVDVPALESATSGQHFGADAYTISDPC